MSERCASYTVHRFIADHALAVAMTVICECLIVIMLGAVQTEIGIVVAACVVIAACALGCAVGTYLRKRRFYRELNETLEDLDDIAHFADMLERPSFVDGQILWDSGARLGRMGAEALHADRREMEDYRRYIEMWVHEIKTPVTAMRLALSQRADSFASTQLHELERMETYIEQVLYFARTSSLSTDYEIKEIDLGAVARAAVKKHAHFLIEHGTTPSFRIDAGMKVLSDEPWLSFIIGQIVTNSAKYGATEIVFEAVTHDDGTAYGRTVLEIRDNGRGIPPQDIGRVFEFGFTGRTGRAQGSATGIGLYLVARLCKAMGIHVGLASEYGSGTRLVLTFPHDRRRYAAFLEGMEDVRVREALGFDGEAEPNDCVRVS